MERSLALLRYSLNLYYLRPLWPTNSWYQSGSSKNPKISRTGQDSKETMMRLIIKIVLGTIILLATFFVSMLGLSEIAGEVVTLTKSDEEGQTRTVRLWIVDDGSSSWVEHGDSSSFWIKQLVENPELKLERDGMTNIYHARADLESHALVHRLLNEKYGVIDSIIRMLSGESDRCPGVPVRLTLKEH